MPSSLLHCQVGLAVHVNVLRQGMRFDIKGPLGDVVLGLSE